MTDAEKLNKIAELVGWAIAKEKKYQCFCLDTCSCAQEVRAQAYFAERILEVLEQ